MLYLQTNFFKAPNDIFGIGLDPKSIATYLYLVRLGNNAAYIYPSEDCIAEQIGVSKPTVESAIKKLEEKGLIIVSRKRQGRKRKYANHYTILPPTKYDPDMEIQ